jgi:hypothetical protein
MRQATLAGVGFERFLKTTRRAAFLAEMEQVVPWKDLCHLIEPTYPKPGNGRHPVGVERMLRIYCCAWEQNHAAWDRSPARLRLMQRAARIESIAPTGV